MKVSRCWLLLRIAPLLACTMSCGEPVPPKYQAFFNLSLSEMGDSIHNYTIPEQIDIYLIGMRQHPPLMGLATAVASNGEAAVPYVLDHLGRARTDAERADLLFILDSMVRNYGVDLRESEDVIRMIEDAFQAIQNPVERRRAEESLARIRADG